MGAAFEHFKYFLYFTTSFSMADEYKINNMIDRWTEEQMALL